MAWEHLVFDLHSERSKDSHTHSITYAFLYFVHIHWLPPKHHALCYVSRARKGTAEAMILQT